MFPAMLLGPSLVGVVLTSINDGKRGVRELISRILRARVRPYWYLVLLIPPALILTILFCFQTFVSPVYAPNHFLIGVLFGLPAGFLEEIGWMGYAFPKMRSHPNELAAAIFLGLLWSVWHLPVIDYLGTATPHGSFRLPFFLVFALAMTAMRVLISWLYVNTQSVFMTQLLHVSSTGSLVIFSAPRITAAQEVLWYGVYGISLWLVVAIIARRFGNKLTRRDGAGISTLAPSG